MDASVPQEAKLCHNPGIQSLAALLCLELGICLQGGGNLGLRAYGIGKVVKFGAVANRKASKQVNIFAPAYTAAAVYYELHCTTSWRATSALGR